MVRFGPVRANQVYKCFFVKLLGTEIIGDVNIRNDIKAVENH